VRRLRPILLAVGVMLTLTGLLWIGQGLGYVHWPESSFMLDQRRWANYGSIVAAFGLLLVLAGRRLR
jgi:hypothetical protein